MSRDLTREDLRAIIRKGLERTSGNYRVMVELFNMPPDDYKRFLGFLRRYECTFRSRNSGQRRSAGGTAGRWGRSADERAPDRIAASI